MERLLPGGPFASFFPPGALASGSGDYSRPFLSAAHHQPFARLSANSLRRRHTRSFARNKAQEHDQDIRRGARGAASLLTAGGLLPTRPACTAAQSRHDKRTATKPAENRGRVRPTLSPSDFLEPRVHPLLPLRRASKEFTATSMATTAPVPTGPGAPREPATMHAPRCRRAAGAFARGGGAKCGKPDKTGRGPAHRHRPRRKRGMPPQGCDIAPSSSKHRRSLVARSWGRGRVCVTAYSHYITPCATPTPSLLVHDGRYIAPPSLANWLDPPPHLPRNLPLVQELGADLVPRAHPADGPAACEQRGGLVPWVPRPQEGVVAVSCPANLSQYCPMWESLSPAVRGIEQSCSRPQGLEHTSGARDVHSKR